LGVGFLTRSSGAMKGAESMSVIDVSFHT
jgi:hypothetical protein